MAKKHTGRALLASGLSLLVSVALLLGITFAWFTDSVTSGRNTITAGNLDVELYHTNATVADEKVTGDTHLFTGENGEDVLWEPGAMAYENFKVVNEGTLALFYRLAINVFNSNTIAGTGQSLADVIRVAVVDGVFNGEREEAEKLDFTSTLAGFAKTGALTQQQDSDTYAVVLYWEPSAADNEYNLGNGKLSSDGNPLFIELGVELNATQTPYESDSFGDQYDENADETVAITSGTGHVLNQDITVVKPNGVGVNVAGQGTEVTIAGGTVNGGSGGNNVGVWAQPGSTVNITGGTFTVGADASGSGNSVVYSTGGVINISGGFFYTDTAYNGKYYVLNLQNGSGGQIHVTGGTFVNFDPSNGDDVNPGSFVEEGYTVVAEQQPNGDTWYTVAKPASTAGELQEAIDNAQDGATVVLTEDIEADTSLAVTEDANLTLDLNGKQITTPANQFCVTVLNRGNLTIKNGKITNLNTESEFGNPAVASVSGNLNLENCTISNKAGISGSYCVQIEGGTATLTDCTINGDRGGLAVQESGQVIVQGGTFTAAYYYPLYVYGNGHSTFTDTKFVKVPKLDTQTGNGGNYLIYNGINPVYGDTGTVTFNSCVFESTRDSGSKLEVYDADSQAFYHLTFNNCTYTNVTGTPNS